MAGEMRERAARALYESETDQDYDPPWSEIRDHPRGDESRVQADAALAVMADVDGIAAVLREHADEGWSWVSDAMSYQARCTCGSRLPSAGTMARHQAEAVAAYLRGGA